MGTLALVRVTLSDGTVEVGPTIGVTYADDRFQWQTITAGEVTVHFYSGNNSFGQQLGAIAKHYPNVYPDLCWAWAMNPAASERAR